MILFLPIQMITSTQKIVAALAQVKVDHKEDLVVPFGIPWHSYCQPSYADHAATAVALFRRLVYIFTPSGPIASPYTPIVTWVCLSFCDFGFSPSFLLKWHGYRNVISILLLWFWDFLDVYFQEQYTDYSAYVTAWQKMESLSENNILYECDDMIQIKVFVPEWFSHVFLVWWGYVSVLLC